MTPLTTLGTYAAGLVLVFGAATALGGVVGPVGAAAPAEHGTGAGHGAEAGHGGGDEHGAGPDGAGLAAGGLAVSQDGYALQLDTAVFAPGRPGRLTFTVTGPDGEPLTDYTRTHDKDLHLVVVRRDLTGYQHVHPERDEAGRWSVPLTLPAAGAYKLVADFQPAGRSTPLALTSDLVAPGTFTSAPLQAPGRTAEVDGYTVTIDGELTAGTVSELSLRVTRGGRPVTDLEPYLGAYGHLVALRASDLAYLHVHPESEVPGPEIVFGADVPAAGAHRLYLDFQHDGVVRTAEFTVTAEAAS